MKTYLLRAPKAVEPQKPAPPQRSKPATPEPKAITKKRLAPTFLAGVSSTHLPEGPDGKAVNSKKRSGKRDKETCASARPPSRNFPLRRPEYFLPGRHRRALDAINTQGQRDGEKKGFHGAQFSNKKEKSDWCSGGP